MSNEITVDRELFAAVVACAASGLCLAHPAAKYKPIALVFSAQIDILIRLTPSIRTAVELLEDSKCQ